MGSGRMSSGITGEEHAQQKQQSAQRLRNVEELSESNSTRIVVWHVCDTHVPIPKAGTVESFIPFLLLNL